MITFKMQFLGHEEDLPYFANVIMGPLELSSIQALALAMEAIDVDRIVELSVRDDVFGRLVANVDTAIDTDVFEADEILLFANEPIPDPPVHRIHIRDQWNTHDPRGALIISRAGY